jgi:hypothetical protein
MLSGLLSSLGLTAIIGGLGAGGGIILALLIGATFRKLVIIAAAVAAGALGLYSTGYWKGSANCQARAALAASQARVAALEKERDALHSTIKRQNELDAQRAKEMAEDDLKIAQFEVILAARGPSESCPVAATANELRSIKGIGSSSRSR